ncbi:adenylate/guanylate cyclase domain-containing protein [Ruegeria aquimaris]|uniref:Adenylate/guanylate cyclase domain-containing protein n=1 Tax=Ruegeria aquimaris TaxID=2984333 RepID=A0ABT3AHB8_9RHOB|nr:adenylate/guanylate cyclase domain-containing protein [Ruegeria sp. XHP0148]MCV2888059.1 adenylate/guanylate cyclase domain-containing protein [Ruegeria sp. XHP0148]
MVDQVKLAAFSSWLMAGAQPPKPIEAVVEESAARLRAAGLPLDVLIVNGLFIHPDIRGIQIRWTARNGVRRVTFRHAYFETSDFAATPISRTIATGRSMRFELAHQDPGTDTAYAAAFRASGYTDILVLPLINFDGTISGCIEFATRALKGFSQEDITALRRVQAPLARMKEFFTERFDKQITLATYVGDATSRKVLSGQIVRGDGETISAVILFADIKGFTALSNRTASAEVLQVLNRFFDVIDTAVTRNNGEILKFLGDGVLVIFPTPDDLTAQEAAAQSAMAAVTEARETLAEQTDPSQIAFRAALHMGDVFFGNVGSRNRLDFTAIGPAVNLCARMLHEASSRDARTLCSAQFRTIAIGLTGTPFACEVAGFEEPVEFHVLD